MAKRELTESRGPSLGDAARIRVLGSSGKGEADASIGHPFFFPKEEIVRSEKIRWPMQLGMEEDLWIVVTSMLDPFGKRTQGRVLLAYEKEAHVAYGGFYFYREYDRTCVQSIYLADSYRKLGLGSVLAQVANQLKIRCVTTPISPDGRRWAERYGLKVVS